jgi:uroporphyrinogen-III decarboxylase
MVGFAEDMSYNHGPMLSQNLYNQFVGPYYRQLVPRLKAAGMKVFVDSDGQVHELLPWLIDCGIEGIYPLERQSGVDVQKIRAAYPRFLMLGGFDKRVMNQGESAIRAEFERLLPVMQSGGFIPSVDHQTPPGVSLDDYRLYLQLLREYAAIN